MDRGVFICGQTENGQAVAGFHWLPWRSRVGLEQRHLNGLIRESRCLWKGLSVYGRVNNVFGETIEEGLGYEQPGVYITAGLSWDFNLTN